MKYYVMLVFALIFVTGEAHAQCVVPPPTQPGKTWYVDPINGSMSGDGSAALPWHTFAEVVNAGLISSQQYPPNWKPGMGLLPQNPKGVVQPGDTILLMSGDHGSPFVRGFQNSQYILVEAAPGQTPTMDYFRVDGADKWIFRGITFQGPGAGVPGAAPQGNSQLVVVGATNYIGPTTNVVFDHNTFYTVPDAHSWTQLDWQTKAATFALQDHAGFSSCARITNNSFSNIYFAMSLSGDYDVISNNTINWFSAHGINFGGSHMTISHNMIGNHINDGTGAHPDCIQGTNASLQVYDVIDGNYCIDRNDPTLTLFGTTMGINIFDGSWSNITISNNVVLTDTYNAITLYGLTNSTVVNNTIVQDGTDTSVTPWIYIAPKKNGTPSQNVTVRNNIANRILISTNWIGSACDHNIIPYANRNGSTPACTYTTYLPISQPISGLFATFDMVNYNYDLHLSALPSGNPAIGTGSSILVPPVDIQDCLRSLPEDNGAYRHGMGCPLQQSGY